MVWHVVFLETLGLPLKSFRTAHELVVCIADVMEGACIVRFCGFWFFGDLVGQSSKRVRYSVESRCMSIGLTPRLLKTTFVYTCMYEHLLWVLVGLREKRIPRDHISSLKVS